jgi:hypothetical protein
MRLLAVLLLAPTVACTSYDHDTTQRIATSGDNVVVAGATVTEGGGFGCGAPSDGDAVLFVSADRGATFERVEPVDARPLTSLLARDGRFFALHSSYDGHAVVSSSDGRAWTELTTGATQASDLLVVGDRLVVVHSDGLRISPSALADGAWTDRAMTTSFAMYEPRMTAVDGTLVVVNSIGQVAHSADQGESWEELVLPGIAGFHRLTTAGGHAIATAHAFDGSGGMRSILVGWDPMQPEAAQQVEIAEGIAMAAVPAGLLVADGTLARDTAQLDDRTSHAAGAFVDAAVDGDRVALLLADGVALSLDSGESFAPLGSLPLLDTRN